MEGSSQGHAAPEVTARPLFFSTTPPVPWSGGEAIRWINPLAVLPEVTDEPLDFLAGPLPPFSFPRNISPYPRLLAKSLSQYRPAGAIFVNPADPREYLAVYEAWRAMEDRDFRIHCLSLHEGQTPAALHRQFELSFRSPGQEGGICTDGKLPSWMEWEVDARNAGWPTAAILQRWVEAERNWFTRPPPPLSPALAGPAAFAGRRIALLGDRLLSVELVRFLEKLGHRAVFIQQVFDLHPAEHGPDLLSAWSKQFAFQPVRQRFSAYASRFRQLQVDRLLEVQASFAPRHGAISRLAEARPWPCLSMEAALPGEITPAIRLRLETFLA